MCVSNKIGPPVEGNDFFGREKEIRLANKLLDRGHSLLLSAPRRIGKSSLAKKLIDEKKKQGWKCVYIDLEETDSEDGFLRLVIDAFSNNEIWKQIVSDTAKGLKSIFNKREKVSVGPVEIDLGEREKKENLYKNLKELVNHEKDTFIVVNELTLFLGILNKTRNGVEKVTYILNWLRSLRQVKGTKIRWLFCGSVGLRNFTSSKNLSYTINDLTEFSLDELDRKEASGLLLELSKSEKIRMSNNVIDYILDKLSWNIPYFIQVIFSKLSEEYYEELTTDSVDAAYKKLCSENYLGTWSERLVEYQEYELPARQILKVLSTQPSGVERNVLLDRLMTGQDSSKVESVDLILSKTLDMLENDGYIMRNGSLRTFRSPLLRDYWLNKFVL